MLSLARRLQKGKQMNLVKLLENSTEKHPDRVALRFEGASYTYAEIDKQAARTAAGLKAAGLKQGDRCILMMQSCPEFLFCYYGLAKLGAVVVPVNFLYKAHELTHIFSDSGAIGYIGMEPYLDEARQVIAKNDQIKVRVATGVGADADFIDLSNLDVSNGFETYAADDDDNLAIIYTSGTTGAPKGAMLTHKNLYFNAMTVADMRQTDPADVVIGVLPLYHIFGQTSVLNSSVYLGLTIELFRAFEPQPVLDLIEREDHPILFAVPTIYNRLLVETENNPPKSAALRFGISGGASMPVEVLRQFENRFNTVIYEGYGLTECSPCVENPYGQKTVPGAIGVPIPGYKSKIVDENSNEVGADTVGELLIKGPGVMKGYLNRPQATAETVVDGWLHTGDMARTDADGYIYIVDRIKDLVIRGGYNVYPREVEEVLYGHAEVVEAGVYGIPHDDLGEEVVADVVLHDGAKATVDDLRLYVKERLAAYKYPRIVNLVDELPKSHTGKILKRELREAWKQKKAL